MFSNNVAIDLGTASIMIYIQGKGIVLTEPSVVAYDTRSRALIAAGSEALKMVGRAPASITVAHPLDKGVISDYEITEQMIRYFLKKVNRRKLTKPKMIVCMPSVVTSVEQRTIIDVCKNVGAKKVCLMEEPLAAAIGAGIDVSKPHGTMVVDIGGGSTDIAVITMGDMAITRSVRTAGNSFDHAIIKYVRRNYSILIGELTAEHIKKEIGYTFSKKKVDVIKAKGRNYITGLPVEFEINSKQVFEALEEPLIEVTNAVHEVLENTPPELISDISRDGILMTGGGSLLKGLDKLIEYKTGVPARVAEDALNCVVLGTGKSLEYISKLPDGSEYSDLKNLKTING